MNQYYTANHLKGGKSVPNATAMIKTANKSPIRWNRNPTMDFHSHEQPIYVLNFVFILNSSHFQLYYRHGQSGFSIRRSVVSEFFSLKTQSDRLGDCCGHDLWQIIHRISYRHFEIQKGSGINLKVNVQT